MKAIISGASKGIGRASAIALAKEGFDLILISRNESDLQELSDHIHEALNPNLDISCIAFDMTNSEEIQDLKMDLDSERLVLVNNVGSYMNDNASSIDLNELERMLSINLKSSIELTKKCLPSLRKAKRSLVVNISSINGLDADHIAASYSISKHALRAWNNALREEVRKEGIKVTALYPGPVNTRSWDGMDVDHEAMIQAEDIGEIIASLTKLSDWALVEEVKINPLQFKLS